MGTRALRLRQARKKFRGRPAVLRGVDLDMDHGESLVILGRSGCGKSTLLRIIAGLDTLDSGTLEWPRTDNGRPRLGVVFQDPLLFPWLTVRENILLGGRFSATAGGFDAGFAEQLLTHFGLASLAESHPVELSGGQSQRVALIRAAALRPRVLLLDEPFSALDPAIRADLQIWLNRLSERLECTTVVVTHDVDEALTLGDRVVLLGDDGLVRREWDCQAAGEDHPRVRDEILTEYRDDLRSEPARASG